MQIQETHLKFDSLKLRNTTRRIILHHSASSNGSAAIFHKEHLSRGWSGLGYHYVIHRDGIVERGRPEQYQGAHAGPQGNPDSIAICLVGNFMNYAPSKEQLNSLTGLIRDIQKRYGRLEVIGHKDVMATACPGALFPWDELNNALTGQSKETEQWKKDIMIAAKQAGLISSDHDPDAKADKWFVLQIALNILKGVK